MAWRVVRNEDYSSRDTTYRGDCPKFEESVTLSIHLSGKHISHHDVQPTFSPCLQGCSLLQGRNIDDTTCMLCCPLFEDYKKSHDY